MKSRAAVAFGPGQPLKIVEIDVAPPKKRRSSGQNHPYRRFAIPMLLPFPAMIRKAYSRQSWGTKAAAW
ncbi:alcohol dehydrogenase class III [Salmonella enterica subsp. enterica]|uniref:Alcohol dehydrogenase class III n=1 Tax=Salmonella enterica I TaxID=59201 RepID=A0A379WTT1_SALET|nr:alcohol dehydrogenase class III [Salmonella enterica subsp. enterica]